MSDYLFVFADSDTSCGATGAWPSLDLRSHP